MATDAAELDIHDLLNRRTDLATFVVHLTKDTERASAADNLRSIIDQQCIEAVQPQGMIAAAARRDSEFRSRLSDAGLRTQQVVCFSETPLEHVFALFANVRGRRVRLKPYGVAMTKMSARRMGANPVWYVDMSPGVNGAYREWVIFDALERLVRLQADVLGSDEDAIGKIAPFIEGMGTWRDRQKEFWWEREWRHVGDVDLSGVWSQLLWLCPETEIPEIRELVGGGCCVDPNWSLERVVAELMGAPPTDITPFLPR